MLWSTFLLNLKSLSPHVTRIRKATQNVKHGVVWMVRSYSRSSAMSSFNVAHWSEWDYVRIRSSTHRQTHTVDVLVAAARHLCRQQVHHTEHHNAANSSINVQQHNLQEDETKLAVPSEYDLIWYSSCRYRATNVCICIPQNEGGKCIVAAAATADHSVALL